MIHLFSIRPLHLALLLMPLLLAGAVSIADDGAMPSSPSEHVLFDFDQPLPQRLMTVQDGAAEWKSDDGQGWLEVATGHGSPWPGVTLRAPQGHWDLSAFQHIEVEIENLDDEALNLFCRVDNPGADGTRHCLTESIGAAPGARATLTVRICATPWRFDAPLELVGMRGVPGGGGQLDTSNVTQLVLFLNMPTRDARFRIHRIRACEPIRQTFSADAFIPFVDPLGQFAHGDWPGKIASEEALRALPAKEEEDLAAHPGPEAWNTYGGWEGGPELSATGSFRVEQHGGVWWLVDPEGRLFWSHGVDCVGVWAGATPITDREAYFAWLPEEDSPFARFYGSGSNAPHGYYEGKTFRTFNYRTANLLRQYGEDYADRALDLTHRRLRSWGFNSMGAWTERSYQAAQRTPYTVMIHNSAPTIEGSSGWWGKFPDPFHPEFRTRLRRQMEGLARQGVADDPWVIGYFIDNELSWGQDTSLAMAALRSPADQPARQALILWLKEKYDSPADLGAAWGAEVSDWSDLETPDVAIDEDKAQADLQVFYIRIAEKYFQICAEEVRRVDPNGLYMGCRFAVQNAAAVRAAARYCDVLSFNIYLPTLEGFRLPEGVDKPVIIGEFHFGALDRGLFHTGLQGARNQEDRADKYERYVEGGLRHQAIVGTHWFQYTDQAVTGRFDGENYQIGLVDVGDQPYPEMRAVTRGLGDRMYRLRLDAGAAKPE